MLPDLFPSLEVRGEAKAFWKYAYRLMLSEGISEAAALHKLDPDGTDPARLLRPDNFPNCFAITQPRPATVPSGGGPKPIVAMSPDAQ